MKITDQSKCGKPDGENLKVEGKRRCFLSYYLVRIVPSKEKPSKSLMVLTKNEVVILLSSISGAKNFTSSPKISSESFKFAEYVVNGEYSSILSHSSVYALLFEEFNEDLSTEVSTTYRIIESNAEKLWNSASTREQTVEDSFCILLSAGVASLYLFIQANLTG